MSVDQEQIYQLLIKKQWPDLLDIIYKYSKTSASDETILYALKIFENEFFTELDKGLTYENSELLLEKLFLLHKGKIYKLSEERAKQLVVEMVTIFRNKGLITKANDYASFYPEHPICAEIKGNIKEPLPIVIKHSQIDQIRVTKNRDIAEIDYTISLFKSKQEIDFFMAVRELFQMFIVYPNVALSCIIDFEKIKGELSQEEKAFFFRGIIDCVVVDQHNNYKPIHFFELDSIYHEASEQKIKDEYKDKILALAGKTLFRIKGNSTDQGSVNFLQLIREIVP